MEGFSEEAICFMGEESAGQAEGKAGEMEAVGARET